MNRQKETQEKNQDDEEEEIRNIYIRTTCIFYVPE